MRRLQILHRRVPVRRALGRRGFVVRSRDAGACPYNVRFINPQTRVAENCDFCLHTKLAKGEDPACVSKCRYGALAFGDLNDPNSYVAKLLDVKDAVRVRTYLGTEPSLRYIPVMKEKI